MTSNSIPEAPGAQLYLHQRSRMIDELRKRGVRDERVLKAMMEVPRHLFVPEALSAKAYGDHALPIGQMQTISQPYMVARMTELLEVNRDSNVLEIGAGSGYQTAVLSHVAGRVFSIERIPELARAAQANIRRIGCYNATVKAFDGTVGWTLDAPYDGILIAAGGPDVPGPLTAQLALGGKLVMPVGGEEDQTLVRITKNDSGLVRETFDSCAFVKLIGRHGWPA